MQMILNNKSGFGENLCGQLNIKDNHEPKNMLGCVLRKIQQVFSGAPSSNLNSRFEAD